MQGYELARVIAFHKLKLADDIKLIYTGLLAATPPSMRSNSLASPVMEFSVSK